jgi:large subunit ribosomal protein L18e
VWNVASERISSPAKNRVEVNLGRISRLAKAGDAVFIPGKVLGTGTIDKKIVVGAFSYSESAKLKIEAAGGSALTIQQFIKKYSKGTGVRLLE